MGGQHRLPKPELRRRLLAQCERWTPEEIAATSRAVCAWVLRLSAFRGATAIVSYAARTDEVSPAAVVEAALRDGKTVYFPRVAGSDLEFIAGVPQYLFPGAYGILEPPAGPTLNPEARDVLFLVPGVAFDDSGARLGRGGGHYDRALARHPHGLRIGLTTEAQLSADLPTDPWDQRVDAVATERRLLWASVREAREKLT